MNLASFPMHLVWHMALVQASGIAWRSIRHRTLFMVTFRTFWSMNNLFLATGHFDTAAPNDPKITLNQTWSHVPHLCVRVPSQCHLSVPHQCVRVPNFSPFRSATSHIRLTFSTSVHIMRRVPRIIPKWPWTTQGQRYLHTCAICVPETQTISVSFGLLSVFWSLGAHFEKRSHIWFTCITES